MEPALPEETKKNHGHAAAISALAHYELQPESLPAHLSLSRVSFLRAFNNWVKSTLISYYSPPAASALDLCCGKGGDLGKWQRVQCAHYVGTDFSENLINLAAERARKMAPRFPVVFVKNADLRNPTLDIWAGLPAGLRFDVVSCQMSAHYFFQSEAVARNFVRLAAERLTPGGYLIGTVPDSAVLLQRARSSGAKGEFGNEFYKVAFSSAKELEKDFDAEYTFYLEDAVGHKGKAGDVKSVPEYVVKMEKFAQIASEYGLEFRSAQNFDAFYNENIWEQSAWKSYIRMVKRHESDPAVAEQWEVAKLYTTFVFQMKGKPQRADMVGTKPGIAVLDVCKSHS